jgi:cation/acetate symporter
VTPAYGWTAVLLVTVATTVIGAFGLRISRTTSDFFVASRSVGAGLNASAIGGEYLSAASFLGIAGLILTYGSEMLWFPVGWTAGYLVLLVLVAAPLRRSGAYTVPDFAEARLESVRVRRVSSALVCLIGWLYLMPQFQGAGVTLQTVTGAPRWAGGVLVALVVVVAAVAGGMRSITFVQAFQYWLKLTAITVPLIFLVMVWRDAGSPPIPADVPDVASRPHPIYSTYSLILATFLGTMGLPHVLVRFYTNPDGRQARRTTLIVLALLGLFYLMPAGYGALGRIYAPDLAGRDTIVLELPGRMIEGVGGELLGALVAGGAFAAFLSTCSGLTISVAGVLSQDLLSRTTGWWGGFRGVQAFRAGVVAAVVVPLTLALAADKVPVASAVGLAFAVAASTFCPLLVLGIWWRGLTAPGALAGLVVGGVVSGFAVVMTIVTDLGPGWADALLSQPAAWTVPAAFATMIGVSKATSDRAPQHVARTMVRLHTPEQVDVDRGPVIVRE